MLLGHSVVCTIILVYMVENVLYIDTNYNRFIWQQQYNTSTIFPAVQMKARSRRASLSLPLMSSEVARTVKLLG